MQNYTHGDHRLTFGRFEADLASGELYKQGRLVGLQEQPFRVLSVLLERPGEVVTREDLRKKLWPHGTFVDFDEGIDTALKKLRQALGDSAQNPVFIETIPKRGYRFIPPVTGNGSKVEVSSVQPQKFPADITAEPAQISGQGVSAIPAPAPTARHMSAVLKYGTLIGIFLVAIVGLYFHRSASHTSPPELKLRQQTFNSVEYPVTSAAISPDGKYLAYSDRKGMHLKLISTGETMDIRPPEAIASADIEWEVVTNGWFPDSAEFLANTRPTGLNPGRWTSETTSIWAVSVLGGPPRKLRDRAVAYSVSPDGSLISFGTNKGMLGEREIWLMSPTGGGARKLYESEEDSSIGGLLWSPDGKRTLYVQSDQSGDRYLTGDLTGEPPATVFSNAESNSINTASWLPDGRLIYSAAVTGTVSDTCNFWTMRLYPRTSLPAEKPRRLTNWAGFCIGRSSVTRDGKQLAFQEWSGHASTYMADLEADGRAIHNPKRLGMEDSEDAIADWTADSKTVIIVRNRENHYILYKQSLQEDVPIVIATSAPGSLLESAQVSPDGHWVILQVYPVAEGPAADTPLLRVPIAGGSPESIFAVAAGSGFTCARPPSNLCALAEPSPDRKQLLFRAFDPVKGKRGSEFARLDVGPSRKDIYWPPCSLSPDGTRLAYSGSPEGPIQILSLNGEASHTIPVKNLTSLRLLGWTGDGKGFFVVSGIKDGTAVQHVDLGGSSQILWKCSGGRQCDFTPSPDGRRLAILDRKLRANIWLMEDF